MKKIVLSPNPYRDRGLVLTNRARELLERDGRETVIAPVFVDVPGIRTWPRCAARRRTRSS